MAQINYSLRPKFAQMSYLALIKGSSFNLVSAWQVSVEVFFFFLYFNINHLIFSDLQRIFHARQRQPEQRQNADFIYLSRKMGILCEKVIAPLFTQSAEII